MRAKPFSGRDRDVGLRRVHTITNWAAAAALAGTGLFAGLASHSGRSTAAPKKARAAEAESHPGSSGADTQSDDGGDGFFQPASAPAPAPAVLPSTSSGFAPIVSGAS